MSGAPSQGLSCLLLSPLLLVCAADAGRANFLITADVSKQGLHTEPQPKRPCCSVLLFSLSSSQAPAATCQGAYALPVASSDDEIRAHSWFAACLRRMGATKLRDYSAKEPRKPVVWEDLSTGKFHAINNETGEKVPCDRDGRPLAQFHLNISGVASTKDRMKLRLKDTALNKSLLSDEPPRPEAPRGAALQALKEERAETKNRFYTKLPSEAGLFLRHTLAMRVAHPELEAERLEEEAKARHKIDELHKNYEALQASASANKTTTVEEKVREVKNISRSEYYSFTATGVFRP
jgi:hypothetical protein